ncbi:MAG: DinB family protein [Acidobacteriota bacterium]|nr:DinB family protein [Acidobacteriota bacterium]
MSADPSGEGWQWTLIQTDPCPQCGQHPAAHPPSDLGRLALSGAADWRAFLAAADPVYLRTNPRPDVWSPLQYGAHSRDMLQVFGDRILLAVAEDDPVVPWFDPGPEAWAAFNRLDPAELAGGIDVAARRLATILDERAPSDWARTARRDGLDRFTVAGLACFAVHEVHHHLRDADGSL